jgi:outer membrane protein
MKRAISRSITFTTLLAAGMGLSALAQAGTTPAAAAPAAANPAPAPTGSTKIAVINFQAAVMQTNEGQRNFAELRKKFEPKQTQLKTEADEIDALKKQLQAAGDKLSDAERQTRLQTIDTKEKAYQRSGEDAQTAGDVADLPAACGKGLWQSEQLRYGEWLRCGSGCRRESAAGSHRIVGRSRD